MRRGKPKKALLLFPFFGMIGRWERNRITTRATRATVRGVEDAEDLEEDEGLQPKSVRKAA
jgi:hypothetical protein